MSADGVNTQAVIMDRFSNTGLTVSLTYPNDRLLVTCAGAIADLAVTDVPKGLVASGRHLHSGSFFLQRALRGGLALLFAEARRLNLSTSLDTGWDPREEWLTADLRATLEHTDTLLVNREELQRLSGIERADEGAGLLLDLGVSEVVVKLGAAGAHYFSRSSRAAAPGRQVSVVDTTGTGDAFNAGYLTGRLSNLTIEERLRLANACGALTAAAVGGTGGVVDRASVDIFAEAGVQ